MSENKQPKLSEDELKLKAIEDVMRDETFCSTCTKQVLEDELPRPDYDCQRLMLYHLIDLKKEIIDLKKQILLGLRFSPGKDPKEPVKIEKVIPGEPEGEPEMKPQEKKAPKKKTSKKK